MPFIQILAFHHSGKPRGWVRFLLFHKNKKPRRIFVRIACKKSGLPRKAFFSWMHAASPSFIRSGHTYAAWIKQFDELTMLDRRAMESNIKSMKEPPIISVVMPTHNTKFEWLREAIDSVRNQIYPHWQLCIADDASTAPHVCDILEHYRELDTRIQIVYRLEGGHISAASNSALGLATGDFVALLDHDDVLSEHALYHVAAALQKNPEAMILYSDEDKMAEDDSRTEPHFKSDWNPDLLFSQNYICHLCVIRRKILQKIGGFRVGVEGSQDHDLLLRCLPHVHAAQIVHIPLILYHWRIHPQSTAQSADGKSYTAKAGLSSLVDFFNGNGPQGVRVEQGLLPNTYRVRWPIPGPEPLVSLIIPTRDCRELVETAISSIIEKSDYQNFEILILDNGSSNADTIDYFVKIQREDTRVRVVPYHHPFNYSAINNYGVTQARGEVIGLINNDIEVISSGWLREMVSHCLRPEIGCVGAKLYYADDTIQHGGIIVGIGGVAGHSHKYFPVESSGYFSRLLLTQNLSAVTAACLLVRKSVYEHVGGLDDEHLTVAFNDVDFCLKVRQEGYRNLWTPYAELYHHESLSRGQEDSPEKIRRFQSEIRFMKEKWGHALAGDPYYNPNLSYEHEDFSLKM
jgi:GT2 family glycosyltransferase